MLFAFFVLFDVASVKKIMIKFEIIIGVFSFLFFYFILAIFFTQISTDANFGVGLYSYLLKFVWRRASKNFFQKNSFTSNYYPRMNKKNDVYSDGIFFFLSQVHGAMVGPTFEGRQKE